MNNTEYRVKGIFGNEQNPSFYIDQWKNILESDYQISNFGVLTRASGSYEGSFTVVGGKLKQETIDAIKDLEIKLFERL